jgi:hypothetical protein
MGMARCGDMLAMCRWRNGKRVDHSPCRRARGAPRLARSGTAAGRGAVAGRWPAVAGMRGVPTRGVPLVFSPVDAPRPAGAGMPAKASVPVETRPGHRTLSGPWAPPTGWWMRHARGIGSSFCRSGPCPRKRWFRLRRFQANRPLAGPWAPTTGAWPFLQGGCIGRGARDKLVQRWRMNL